jgi:hypothetical protein
MKEFGHQVVRMKSHKKYGPLGLWWISAIANRQIKPVDWEIDREATFGGVAFRGAVYKGALIK